MDNNINTSRNALDGTVTAENLKLAFEKEAAAAMRAGIYSKAAAEEKDAATKRLLDEIRDNGTTLGELWLGYAEGAENTDEALVHLAEIKTELNGQIYRDMAKTAEEEGFDELSEKFNMAADVQKRHGEQLKARAAELDGEAEFEANSPHVCPFCGYVTFGNAAPEICPLCGAILL